MGLTAARREGSGLPKPPVPLKLPKAERVGDRGPHVGCLPRRTALQRALPSFSGRRAGGIAAFSRGKRPLKRCQRGWTDAWEQSCLLIKPILGPAIALRSADRAFFFSFSLGGTATTSRARRDKPRYDDGDDDDDDPRVCVYVNGSWLAPNLLRRCARAVRFRDVRSERRILAPAG